MLFIIVAIPVGISVRRQHKVTIQTYEAIKQYKCRQEEGLTLRTDSSLIEANDQQYSSAPFQQNDHQNEKRANLGDQETVELKEIQIFDTSGHVDSIYFPDPEETSNSIRRILRAKKSFEGRKKKQLSFRKGDLVEEIKTTGNWYELNERHTYLCTYSCSVRIELCRWAKPVYVMHVYIYVFNLCASLLFV